MLRKILFIGLWACLLSGAGVRLYAQDRGVVRTWGRVLGKAQTDRDFLIYNAVCAQNKPALFIVGKAENSSMEIKQNGTAYHHAKDENTDAFLACMSLNGELLWSTYLPALEDGYYNAFATTVEYTKDNTVLVIGNAYQIQENLENTKNLIPKCPGKLFFFEFDTDGHLLRSKTLSFSWRLGSNSGTLLDIPYPPRIAKITEQAQKNSDTDYILGGIVLSYYSDPPSSASLCFVYSHSFTTGFSWQSNTIEYVFPNIYDVFYSAAYPLTISDFANIVLQTKPSQHQLALGCRLLSHSRKSEKTTTNSLIYSRGIDLLELFPILENWSINNPGENHGHNDNKEGARYIGDPIETRFYSEDDNSSKLIFPGTVQNIRTYKNKYIVQGIHCRNYSNGFFKTGSGGNYAYSHDNTHPIPMPIRGFYQSRNSRSTAVPYLLIYDSAALSRKQYSEPDLPETKVAYDFEAPLWGSYLDADWLYEDIFHIADSTQWKDLYQPYEPVLCSYNNKFFLIGNAKYIDYDLIDNPTMTEEVFHHQGVVLAFSSAFEGDCPVERNTVFEDVRFLCPGDSVELNVPSDYIGFKFRFDPAFLADGSIVLNADNSRAWAKQEGSFTATLDGSTIRCPDVTVDTVRISLSPYPEPVSTLNPDSTITACATMSVVLQAVTEPDSTFSYRWFDGDSVNQKNVRFTNNSLFFASVEVNGYCTSFRDSTQIRFLPPYVDLEKDSLLCTSRSFADTSILLHLSARQDYFPDADWIFRWQINGKDASDKDSLLLRYADLEDAGINLKTAFITVAVSLSDADGCTAYDTLVFSLASLPDGSDNFFLPQSEILCAHKDLELFLPDTANNYRCFWLDQDSVPLPYGYDTNRFTIVGMRGTDGFGANTDTRNPRFFQLRLDHKLCGLSFFDTLLVYDQVKPGIELPFHDTLICFNEPVALDSLNPLVYRPFYAFEWNEGTKGSGHTFTDSGLYILRFFVLEDFAVCGYDTASDTILVRWSDPAQTLISIPSDTAFCEKLSVTLDATVPFPSTRYSWQEGNLDDLFSPLDDSTLFTSPIIKVDKTVSLALFVVDTMGCVNTRQIEVTEEDCKPSLSVPNVFTPNGDGVNDVLKFKQMEHCYDVDILIVDRKGSHVLHEKVKDPDSFSWNGCLKNGSRKLPDGAYFYFISYKNAYGKKKYQSGSITILGSRE